MNEPTMWTIAIGVLALLLCLRRRRTGEPPAVDAEESRAADEAFRIFNDEMP